MNLDELKTRVDTARKALPAKNATKKRAAAIDEKLKNNAKKGDRDGKGKAQGKLEGKTPKLRAPKVPKVKKPK